MHFIIRGRSSKSYGRFKVGSGIDNCCSSSGGQVGRTTEHSSSPFPENGGRSRKWRLKVKFRGGRSRAGEGLAVLRASLVAWHFCKRLVKLVRDGFELLLLVYQLICKARMSLIAEDAVSWCMWMWWCDAHVNEWSGKKRVSVVPK